MAGFGTTAFGTTPFGFGAPDDDAQVPTVPTTACRYINPATRDYEQDTETLQLAQTTPVRQRVILRLGTVLRSSTALPDLGMPLGGKMDETFAAVMTARVYEALRQETDVEQVLRILSVEVLRGTRRAAIHIQYLDLTTGREDDVTV